MMLQRPGNCLTTSRLVESLRQTVQDDGELAAETLGRFEARSGYPTLW
ncbi:MAG: hypothetical protein U0996_15160 [Planctomycetaceae bacterium]